MGASAAAPRILVVDDDEKTVAAIRLYLEHHGYTVAAAGDGARALAMVGSWRPDLILLDVMLPSVDGLDICRTLRRAPGARDVPIILLTARTTEGDKLRGFGVGADDYVTKPFSPRELVARVQAVLRRSGVTAGADILRIRDLAMDRTRHEVHVAGRRVALTPVEFRLLDAFMRAPGRAFTRAELVERAFGDDFDGLDRTVDAHVMNLRKKLEPARGRPSYIVTVYGVGYKLADTETGD